MEKYLASVYAYGPYIYIPLAIDHDLANAATMILQKYFPDSLTHVQEIIFTPLKQSNALLERQSFLRLTIRYYTNSKQGIEDESNQHVEKFSFL